jgi:hypothetical protein
MGQIPLVLPEVLSMTSDLLGVFSFIVLVLEKLLPVLSPSLAPL